LKLARLNRDDYLILACLMGFLAREFACRDWSALDGVETHSGGGNVSPHDHRVAKGMQVPGQLMGGGAGHMTE
jgi:hypothetical protein